MDPLPIPVYPGDEPKPPRAATQGATPAPASGVPSFAPAPGTAPAPINPATGREYVKHENPLETLGRLIEESNSKGGSHDATALLGPALAPIQIASTVLGHLPVPGADATFEAAGEAIKASGNEQAYKDWLYEKEVADADTLGGASRKAAFNKEYLNWYADQQKETPGIGTEFYQGPGAIGSVGDAITQVAGFLLGGGRNIVTRNIMNYGESDSKAFGDNITHEQQVALDRWAWAEYKVDHPGEAAQFVDPLSPIEEDAVAKVRSGEWTLDHGKDYLVTHGEGYSSDPARNIVGESIFDPLIFAAAGEGAVSNVVRTGAKIAESGLPAATAYEKLAVKLWEAHEVPGLKHAWTAMGTLANPFPHFNKFPQASTAVRDLYDGSAVAALGRTHTGGVEPLYRVTHEIGMADELAQDMGAYARHQADTMLAAEHVESELKYSADGAEGLAALTTPEEVLAKTGGAATGDAVDRLTNRMYRVSVEPTTESELAQLVNRAAAAYGGGTEFWTRQVARMNIAARSLLHATTFANTTRKLMEAIGKVDRVAYDGKAPIERLAVVNEQTLTDVSANAVLSDIKGPVTGAAGATRPKTLAEKLALWEHYTQRHPALLDISARLPKTARELDLVMERLAKNVKGNKYIRVMTNDELGKPALHPLQTFLDSQTIDGERMWELGFMPEGQDAWGLTRDAITGALKSDRQPSIPYVVDAVPGAVPFGETIRNHLGQIIGERPAAALTKPVDAITAMRRTAADQVAGQRALENQAKRFERGMTKTLGVPRKVSRDIWAAAMDHSARMETVIKGVQPTDNFWQDIKGAIPEDFRMTNGDPLNVHIVLDQLLEAAGGDIRMVGVAPALTQRSRDILRRSGVDPSNWVGYMTSNMYQKLRYKNPMFLIQRITDSPYFGVFYGVAPVGRNLDEALMGARDIEHQIGLSMTSRDFAMDNQEFLLRSNWGNSVDGALLKASRGGQRMKAVQDAPDLIVANNITKQFNARLGRSVREALDQLEAEISAAPAELQAGMRTDWEQNLNRNFAELRAIYSRNAGKALSDDEVGLRFIQDQLHSNRNIRMNATGIDPTDAIHEATYHAPTDVGEIQPLLQDHIAIKAGYKDAKDLRRALHGWTDKDGAIHPPTRDMEWLDGFLRDELHAHPDYTARFKDYFSSDWDTYWSRLKEPIADGGMDLSARSMQDAQALVSTWAQQRGMDPWEYLTQVLKTNLGPGDSPEQALLQFIQAGGVAGAPFEAWLRVFRGNLDLSAQRTLLETFKAEAGAVEPSVRATFEGASLADAARADASRAAGSTGLTAEQGAEVQALYDAGKPAEGAALQQQYASAAGGTAASGGATVAHAPEVAQGGTVDEVLQFMGVHNNETTQGLRPDLYETHPKSGFQVRNSTPSHHIVAGPNGEPMLVDRVPSGKLGAGLEDVPGSERPLDYVYRAVSEEDYQNIVSTGVMKSDGRMNLDAAEGTVTSHGDPSFYLPGRNQASAPLGEHPGRIIRIKVDPADGWQLNPHDSYIKTSQEIPASRIDMVSPPLVTTKGTKVTPRGSTIETVDTAIAGAAPAAPATPIDEAIARVEGQQGYASATGGGPATDEVFDKIAGATGDAATGEPGTVKVVARPEGGEGWRDVYYYGDDGTVAGHMSVNVTKTDAGEAGVYTVNVRPSLKRTGIGTKMYDAVQASGEMDLVPLIGTTRGFSPEGREFALKWLRKHKADSTPARLTPSEHAAAVKQHEADLAKADEAEAKFEADMTDYADQKEAYDAAVKASEESAPKPEIGAFLGKWENRGKNSMTMERDLDQLEVFGHDVSEARDALKDYVARAKMVQTQADRDALWDEVINRVAELQPAKTASTALPPAPVKPTRPRPIGPPPADMQFTPREVAVDAVRQAGFLAVGPEKFFASIRKATKVVKSNGRAVGETVYVYPKSEYANMRLWLSADGKTGFAIKPDGDLVSVFNVGDKGRIQSIIPHVHDLGATKLDAFDEAGRLTDLYKAGGFRVTRREKWNPDYAPEGWTGGTPDVVYMEHGPAPKFNFDTPTENAARLRLDKKGNIVLPKGFQPEKGYVYRVDSSTAAHRGFGPGSDFTNDPTHLHAMNLEDDAIYRIKTRNNLERSRTTAQADRLTSKHVPAPDIEVYGADGQWHALPGSFDEEFDRALGQKLLDRAARGTPDPNPEVESYANHFSNWMRQTLGEHTRADLAHLTDNIPVDRAVSYNHSEARMRSLLSRKLRQEHQNIFMLAEMGSNRSVAMRSVNHPFFGIYPAAYMWGKVFPQVAKFLAQNPYGFTYGMLGVQRSIALQRELDPNFEKRMANIDRSATAFMLGYMTPSLPWEQMQASMPPVLRALRKDNPTIGTIWDAELRTVSPERWFSHFTEPAQEALDQFDEEFKQEQAPIDGGNPLRALEQRTGQTPAEVPQGAPDAGGFHGATPAAGLQPVLDSEMDRLSHLFGS